MNKSSQYFQRGLSLVEVFVALLVLSVGLIALAKLQVDLVRGGSDARARTMALNLAEEKIEDLRTFSVSSDATACPSWSTSANPMCWSYIAANAGGRIASGSATVAGVQYSRSWTASNRDFTGTGPVTSHTKDVVLTVTWVNEQGATQTVTSNANIVEIPPGTVALASQPAAARPPGPAANYTPGAVPEVVAVPINNGSGGKRETTKPLPDVMAAQGFTHMVSFDEVNYHLVGTQNVIDNSEKFRTVNCRCALAAAGRARTPARISYVNGKLRDRPGAVIVSKAETGVTLTTGNTGVSQQPPECDICCRDHHDGPAQTINGTTDYNRYNPTATSDHLHYLVSVANNGTISYTQAQSAGDPYDEACRMKIVNGVLQVFQDWQLQTVTVMPKTDLANSDGSAGPKLSSYTTAVQNFVMGVASAQAGVGTAPINLSAWFTPSAVSVNPATPQLLARAIYIDYMPPNLLTAINGILTDGDPTNDASIMALVPFYEVHMTKLADWSIYPNLTNALVSSDPIHDDSTGLVSSTIYSRGFVQPSSNPTASTPTAVASIKSHNTGVTDTVSVNTSYEAPHQTTATTIGSGASAPTYYATSTNPTSETSPATSQHKDGTLGLTVAANTTTITIAGTFYQANKSGPITGTPVVSIAGVNCSVKGTLNDNKNPENFTCSVTADASGTWSGTINFALSPYQFCQNDTVKTGNTYSPCLAFLSGNWSLGPLSGNSTGNKIFISTTTLP